MKAGFLITARMKSTRLPKKLVLQLAGREVIRWMIDRLKLSQCLNNIIICTSTNRQDDILQEIADQEGIDCFRGSEEDVILRLRDAARKFELDYAFNVTADCPLVSYEHLSEMLTTYTDTEADLLRALDLPHGIYSYGLKPSALEEVCRIKKSANTEVWGEYFSKSDVFRVVDLKVPADFKRPDYRLTLDYPEDLEFLKTLFDGLGPDAYKKTVKEIVAFLDANPEIVQINSHCEKLYEKRLERQAELST